PSGIVPPVISGSMPTDRIGTAAAPKACAWQAPAASGGGPASAIAPSVPASAAAASGTVASAIDASSARPASCAASGVEPPSVRAASASTAASVDATSSSQPRQRRAIRDHRVMPNMAPEANPAHGAVEQRADLSAPALRSRGLQLVAGHHHARVAAGPAGVLGGGQAVARIGEEHVEVMRLADLDGADVEARGFRVEDRARAADLAAPLVQRRIARGAVGKTKVARTAADGEVHVVRHARLPVRRHDVAVLRDELNLQPPEPVDA